MAAKGLRLLDRMYAGHSHDTPFHERLILGFGDGGCGPTGIPHYDIYLVHGDDWSELYRSCVRQGAPCEWQAVAKSGYSVRLNWAERNELLFALGEALRWLDVEVRLFIRPPADVRPYDENLLHRRLPGDEFTAETRDAKPPPRLPDTVRDWEQPPQQHGFKDTTSYCEPWIAVETRGHALVGIHGI